MAPASAVSVALIAQGILERRVRFNELDAVDFSTMQKYGTSGSYKDETVKAACMEAWELVRKAEQTRPKGM